MSHSSDSEHDEISGRPMVIPGQTKIIEQNLLNEDHPRIELVVLLESTVTDAVIDRLFEGGASGGPQTCSSDAAEPQPMAQTHHRVGLAPGYSQSGHLTVLAVATAQKVLIVQFHAKGKAETRRGGRNLLQARVFANPDLDLYAFDLGPLAAAMYYDHRLRLRNAINIQSACSGGDDAPFSAIQFAVGDRVGIFKENVTAAFQDTIWDPTRRPTGLALRAWIAYYISGLMDMEERFRGVKRVNTEDMEDGMLELIAQLAHGDGPISKDAAMVKNEYAVHEIRDNNSKVKATRFSTRFQKHTNVRMNIRESNGAQYTVTGRISDIKGRQADIKTSDLLEGKVIASMTTINGNKATRAEKEKNAALLRVLQGQAELFKTPFLNYMFFSSAEFLWPETFESSTTVPAIKSKKPLNDSQQAAVEHMLTMTNDTRFSVIQGPPGTGKTSVIAAFVCSSVAAGLGNIWLVAQSNYAVKNIAEKLADVGFFNWKLLVSAEFETGWHEELYHKLNRNIIRSYEFKKAHSQIQGCSVILCTLAMLSNPLIQNFTSVIPIRTLVVDEASQIAVADYLSPLSNHPTIRKLCFIGDDKQLPPFGQEDNEEKKSVFEMPHLRSHALFLNTQYRMPPQIGDFISDAVYDGQLRSNPQHPVQVADTATTCYFIDVVGSKERQMETSWHNPLERQAVLKIAARMHSEGKSYHIITPYDAQRSALEKDLQNAGLPWQDKCSNVDPFQGNEDDYIVITLVRSARLGFLKDLRRTNVMLSRCKRGMFICSNWDFLAGVGRDSLAGQMAARFGDTTWLSTDQLESHDYELY